jgi:glycosyltransferase involved in cell wall biosynthesis
VVTDVAPTPRASRRRAVILVGNPANPYSRAIRIGRTLVANGYDVEIAAPVAEGAAELEQDGSLVIRRYRPSGPFATLATAYGARPAQPPLVEEVTPSIPRRILRRLRYFPRRILRKLRNRSITWFLWPHTVRGWWHTLELELEPADLYHACGVLAIPAALAARSRDRRAGRRSVVIHDVIDFQLDSNNVLGMPSSIRRFLVRREGRWARAADAHTSVNEVFARRATMDWRLLRRPVVVPNYPEPWDPPAGGHPDRIREAVGLPPTKRICMFWGRLGPYVGLDQMAEAVMLVPDTVLVVMGFGRGWDASVSRDADPRFAGRHFTIPAVHPDELVSWVASADVAMVTLPPLSYNQRYTTPNKFLEALAAGTPIVLGPDLPTMAGILQVEEAGRVAASMSPRDIGEAIASILDLPAAERLAWRARLAAVARERYSWPIGAAAYETVLRDIEALAGGRT